MRQPKEDEHWIVNTSRIDPETNQQLPSIKLMVMVARVDESTIKKGIVQATGREYEVTVPARVHFKFVDNSRNRELEVANLLGSYELSEFVEKSTYDGG